MFRLLRGVIYGITTGIALAVVSCAVTTVQKQQRIAVIRVVLSEQLKAWGRLAHDESLSIEAERIAHGEM